MKTRTGAKIAVVTAAATLGTVIAAAAPAAADANGYTGTGTTFGQTCPSVLGQGVRIEKQ